MVQYRIVAILSSLSFGTRFNVKKKLFTIKAKLGLVSPLSHLTNKEDEFKHNKLVKLFFLNLLIFVWDVKESRVGLLMINIAITNQNTT